MFDGDNIIKPHASAVKVDFAFNYAMVNPQMIFPISNGSKSQSI